MINIRNLDKDVQKTIVDRVAYVFEDVFRNVYLENKCVDFAHESALEVSSSLVELYQSLCGEDDDQFIETDLDLPPHLQFLTELDPDELMYSVEKSNEVALKLFEELEKVKRNKQ